jgi:hypothetical protein
LASFGLDDPSFTSLSLTPQEEKKKSFYTNAFKKTNEPALFLQKKSYIQMKRKKKSGVMYTQEQ